MQRRPSTQDVTWLLDLHHRLQLDLEPPYQRRSVWTRRDRQFFLDTIFRNYPSPAIFLHKSVSDGGHALYHVVDGKQRIETILAFVNDKVRISDDYGDVRLNGKRWSDLQGETELKQRFWNYQITVEQIDIMDGSIVNEVFDRLNRNARKLTRQELRHAKFDGWLINEAEAESAQDQWRAFRITSTARSRRMTDNQFISELMFVVLEKRIMGFDQDDLDDLYAKYDAPSDTVPDLDVDAYREQFSAVRGVIAEMEAHNGCVSEYANGFGHFYTLWALVALGQDLPAPADLAHRYAAFMSQVRTVDSHADLDVLLRDAPSGAFTHALAYSASATGASTDLGPRQERLTALRAGLLEA